MPYKFNCRECKNFVYIPEILDGRQTYYCKSCNIDNTFNEKQAHKFFNIEKITQKEFEKETGEKFENIDGGKNNKNNRSEKKDVLSEKYDVLKSYKDLAYLLMIASTGFFLYEAVQFANAENIARELLKKVMITSTVSYLITIFSLFCLTKMIDFLFDLDKHKSDK